MKETIKKIKIKRQSNECEKIFANCIFNRRLIFQNIYRIHYNSVIESNLIKNRVLDMNRLFFQRDTDDQHH